MEAPLTKTQKWIRAVIIGATAVYLIALLFLTKSLNVKNDSIENDKLLLEHTVEKLEMQIKITTMNLKFLKLGLTLITLITINSIAFGQTSSNDSITISRTQQRQCIVWYKEGIYKDSIIESKDSVITIQRDFIQYTDTTINKLNGMVVNANKRLQKMKKKRRNAFIIGGVTTLGAFIFGFFIKP